MFVLAFFAATLALSSQLPHEDPFSLVNTSYDEQNPMVSPDGKTLFLTIRSHPMNVGGVKDPGDIWISRWSGTGWSAPEHGGDLINNRFYNGVASISADGNSLFLLNHYEHSGSNIRTQGLSVSHLTRQGWSKPQNISIPYFHNKSENTTGYVANDVFVYSAETYGTYGVEDIYVSIRKEDGKWSEPKNLGNTINTPFQELSPSLSKDGKILYFSTNGRKGYGSFDVYYAVRKDDTWQNWSEPVNMGAAINSEGRELFYREVNAEGAAFYTSTLNSDGYGDIKLSMENTNKFVLHDTSVSASNQPSIVTDNTALSATSPTEPYLITLYGTVQNVRSGMVVTATLNFESPSLDKIIASDEKGYTVSLSQKEKYFVTISSPGFISTMEKIEALEGTKAIEMNFKLQPIEKGATVNLTNVLFEKSSDELLETSYHELDMVVSFLSDNPTVKIGLSGHTDNRGVHSHNVKLSQQRVNKVKAYLISKGIDSKRITGKGFGGLRPIASNDTEETRRLNRRVEFTIIQF